MLNDSIPLINPLSDTPNSIQTTITTLPISDIPKKKSIPPGCNRKTGQLNKKTLKAIDLSIKHEIDPATALSMAHNRVPSQWQIDNFKKTLDKYQLSHPRMVKLARNVVLSTLRGDEREVTQQVYSKTKGEVIEFTEKIVPSCTNQLAAASMVYDRADPVVHQAVNINLNADVDPIDLERWRNG